jgi:phage terminase small subunit
MATAKKTAQASPRKKTVANAPTSDREASRQQGDSQPKPLTDRQKRFVDEYLIDLNATAAYKRAGYAATGNAAEVGAHQLLRNPKVAQAVAAAQQNRAERTHITQDRVLQELARLAFVDLRRAYNEDGTLKLPSELDDDTAAAMAGMETLTTNLGGSEGDTPDSLTTKKVKIFDKKGALELCMRHLGMLNDKLDLNAKVSGNVSYKANIPSRG